VAVAAPIAVVDHAAENQPAPRRWDETSARERHDADPTLPEFTRVREQTPLRRQIHTYTEAACDATGRRRRRMS
jgi:hypothetical protein